jgi:hypothetical protein
VIGYWIVDFDEPLCSPYWDQFKDKVGLYCFDGTTFPIHIYSKGCTAEGSGRHVGLETVSLDYYRVLIYIPYHRDSKPTWKTSTKEKMERSFARQHQMTSMDNTLTILIPALIGSVFW